jgi:hypothetical protein
MTRKLLTAAGVIIAVMWVMHNPDAAAADLRQFIHALGTLASAL